MLESGVSVTKANRIPPGFGFLLDITRAFAAIMVFIEHLRAPLYHGFSNLADTDKNVFVQIWFFVAGFGFEAVVIFFVMSGFLIGGNGFIKISEGRFSLTGYTVDRIARLFVVLIPALILTFIIDRIGITYFSNTGFWNGSNSNFSEKFGSFVENSGISNLVCNGVMLQSFRCPVYGSNVPLWSLSYEFWFYVIFFCFAFMKIGKTGTAKLISVGSIVLISVILGDVFIKYLFIWIIGVFAYIYRGRKFRWPFVSAMVYIFMAVISRLSGVGDTSGSLMGTFILFGESISFGWVIISFKDIRWHPAIWLSGLGSRLASFSYTLYLIHFPVMLIVVAIISKIIRIDITMGIPPNSILGISMYVGVIFLVMFIAKLFSSLTEAHTRYVREALLRLLSRGVSG